MTATHAEHASMTNDGCPHDAPEYTPGAVGFSDYPHAQRMAYRDAIERAGAYVTNYTTRGAVQVAAPRVQGPFFRAMAAAGLTWHDRGWYFPLGSDAPPDDMRHDGRYPGSAGFWLYVDLFPTDPPTGPSDY